MTDPYLGEIQIFGFNFPPYGWAFCAGQTIPISQNTPLFSLIGTSYGGNGQSTFQLPNLAGRAACGQGQGAGLSQRTVGEVFGENAVSLLPTEIPSHTHSLTAYAERGEANKVGKPATGVFLGTPGNPLSTLASATTNTTLNPNTISAAGGSAPHENRQPFLALNYSICLNGVFPTFP